MEDAGTHPPRLLRRGLGGAQFALPAALDLLRAMRELPDEPRTVVLAATDPANPYGAIVKWPDWPARSPRPSRAAVRRGLSARSSSSSTASPPPTCAAASASCWFQRRDGAAAFASGARGRADALAGWPARATKDAAAC